jgi:competence protein ComEA
MYKKVRDYFNISRQELRGMMIFLILLICIYISPYIYEYFFFKSLDVKIETVMIAKEEINNFILEEKFNKTGELDNSHVGNDPIYFNFNPNHLPLEDWIKLGLTEKQANIIKKYEAKGGKFYKKEDLKKIYSISEKQYNLLLPYIHIPSRVTENKFERLENIPKDFKKNLIVVQLNTADSIDLLQVKGIGPAFASRIIKYRKRLGGFVNKNQLKEIYGIDSLKFVEIQHQLKIDDENITPIKINECNFEDLKMFPYLSYKQMNAIIAYRKQHGSYKNLEDLNKIVLLNKEVITKIAPYIKFNDRE